MRFREEMPSVLISTRVCLVAISTVTERLRFVQAFTKKWTTCPRVAQASPKWNRRFKRSAIPLPTAPSVNTNQQTTNNQLGGSFKRVALYFCLRIRRRKNHDRSENIFPVLPPHRRLTPISSGCNNGTKSFSTRNHLRLGSGGIYPCTRRDTFCTPDATARRT